jgi:hypothetical protein
MVVALSENATAAVAVVTLRGRFSISEHSGYTTDKHAATAPLVAPATVEEASAAVAVSVVVVVAVVAARLAM